MPAMSGFDERSRSTPWRSIIGSARTAVRACVIVRVEAPQGLLLIEDSGGAELPLSIPGQLVAATATSVAVACATSAVTEVGVGGNDLPLPGVAAPVYDGRLATPTRKLAVRTVLGATLLEVVVPSTETHIRIWTNAGAEPTQLTIGAAGAGAAVAR
jgi:hypothetical protein